MSLKSFIHVATNAKQNPCLSRMSVTF